MANTKYIFITGGVSSSLGGGLLAASLAKLLQANGYTVALQKLDPYINVNSGMLNPYEHGECYVTDDGHEGDIDLGVFERFSASKASRNSDVTAGRVFQNVIRKEREGAYLGKTVQVVPNITNEIKQHIYRMSNSDRVDFVIVEIGGTVGDIESLPFIEAERQVRYELGRDRWMSIHLTFVPYIAAAKELKTKPTQHSVKELLELGVQPDMLVLRTEHSLNERSRAKVGLFCNVQPEAVIELLDQPSQYDCPIVLHEENIDGVVLEKFGLKPKQDADEALAGWKRFVKTLHNAVRTVKIALVGKYVELPDAYRSIREALVLAAAHYDHRLELTYIQAEKITELNARQMLEGLDAILVAPGFGQRGVDGKMQAVKYARLNNVPFFGIGLGMQCAVIDFAKNVMGLLDADSTELNQAASCKVFDICADEKSAFGFDGTMRLGAYNTRLKEGSKVAAIYGTDVVSERHRHRFEFNNDYADRFEEKGMVISGANADFGFADIVEIPEHPWFVGTIFHPEFNSVVGRPHPLFLSFVEAAIKYSEK
ncbi:MAG: CTP synthase [Paludibacteraceae bacterium]|nr:CTP synthase [Paludibacteraceae bacterium]MBR6043227.1 CTP synthase [Paludibacteraceae bacterium]MCR5568945.1 CTP synthase [Paludibacteraceae bacterium]